MRKLFGGGETPPPGGGRPRAAVPRQARPARPRTSKSDPGAGVARSRAGAGDFEQRPEPPAAPELASSEVACPNCGEPMLSGWGTTCGKCRPNLVSAKTLFLAPGQVALPPQSAGGMTLGWLVVLSSTDEARQGSLVELDNQRVVLSRAGSQPQGTERLVEFDDGFMSSGHAILNRPGTGERTDSFTIRDRDNPAPSVNGTFVNSRKLGPGEVVRLADGDVIKVGTNELLFKSLWLPPVANRGP